MPNCSIIVQEAFNAGWNFSERTVNCDRNGGGQFDIMPYMSIYLNKNSLNRLELIEMYMRTLNENDYAFLLIHSGVMIAILYYSLFLQNI